MHPCGALCQTPGGFAAAVVDALLTPWQGGLNLNPKP